jgi:hypothetical protein
MGYGVIGSPTDSGSVSLGSSPGTPATDAAIASGGWFRAPQAMWHHETRWRSPAPSSSGLGRRPLKAVAPVRIRSGLHPVRSTSSTWTSLLGPFCLARRSRAPRGSAQSCRTATTYSYACLRNSEPGRPLCRSPGRSSPGQSLTSWGGPSPRRIPARRVAQPQPALLGRLAGPQAQRGRDLRPAKSEPARSRDQVALSVVDGQPQAGQPGQGIDRPIWIVGVDRPGDEPEVVESVVIRGHRVIVDRHRPRVNDLLTRTMESQVMTTRTRPTTASPS